MQEEMKHEAMPEHNDPMPKKDAGKMIWMIVAIVAILALIGSIGYGYMSMKNLNKKISDQQAQINNLSNTKKTLEDAASAAATAATDAAAKAVGNAISNQTDNQQIQTVTKNTIEAQVTQQGKITSVTVTKTEGNFAAANYTSSSTDLSSSGQAFLKKVNGQWVVILPGVQAVPSASEGKLYGLPTGWYQ